MKTRVSKSLLALLIIGFMVIGNILIVNPIYSLTSTPGPFGLHLDLIDEELIRPDNESLIYSNDSDDGTWVEFDEEETPKGSPKLPDIFIKPDNESLIYNMALVEDTWVVIEEEVTPRGAPKLPDIFIKPDNESIIYNMGSVEDTWVIFDEEETPAGAPEFIQPDNSSKLYEF